MDRTLKVNGFYRHFKGNMYYVKGTAIDSETGTTMVIYDSVGGVVRTYVRPLDMFLSEVDHEKYPDVTQKYRFEVVDNLI